MAYATRDQLKNELGISLADTSQDSYLDDLLSMATSYIDLKTGRQFGSNIVVTDEVHDYIDNNKIWLQNTDITAVDSVVVGQQGQTPVTLDTTAYIWNSVGRIVIFSVPSIWPNAPRGVDRDFYLDYIKVSYKFGVAAPKVIELACVQLAALVYRNDSISSERIGDYSIAYKNMDDLAGTDIMGILSAYRIQSV